MNKIYEHQLELNKMKLFEAEKGRKVWKRKHMSDVSIPKGETSPVKKKDLPQEPTSDLAPYTGADLAWDVAGTVDPTGVVDLANAARYAAKGQWGDAAISALGAIPYVGDLGKAGRVAKAVTKVDKPITVTAKRVYPKAASVTEVKPFKPSPKPTAGPAIPQSLPSANLPMQLPSSPSGGSLAVRKTGALAKTTRDIATGAAASEIIRAAKRVYDDANDNEDDDEDNSKSKMVIEPKPETQLNLQRLSVYDPGDPSGYSKSVVAKRGHEELPHGYHPFFTGPIGIETNRRRSTYAHKMGLPESIENENIIKNRIKNSVKNYLKSQEGKKLNNHLENIRKSIDLR